jgi:hypothetical protein
VRRIAAAILVVFATSAAHAGADNCRRSREYLLGSLSGDLKLPPQSYNDLFKICLAASSMTNVKDAYILRDGGIAVIPKQDTIPATASTLSQFCDAYPSATLRFLSGKEVLTIKSVTDIVQLSSTSATPCKKIKGLT